MIFLPFTQKLDIRFLILYPIPKEEFVAIAKNFFRIPKEKFFLNKILIYKFLHVILNYPSFNGKIHSLKKN